jgi:hypothetical protein
MNIKLLIGIVFFVVGLTAAGMGILGCRLVSAVCSSA